MSTHDLPLENGWIDWNESLVFDIDLQNIPRAAKLCFALYNIVDKQAEKQKGKNNAVPKKVKQGRQVQILLFDSVFVSVCDKEYTFTRFVSGDCATGDGAREPDNIFYRDKNWDVFRVKKKKKKKIRAHPHTLKLQAARKLSGFCRSSGRLVG